MWNNKKLVKNIRYWLKYTKLKIRIWKLNLRIKINWRNIIWNGINEGFIRN